MKTRARRLIAAGIGVTLLLSIALSPGFPWSNRCRNVLTRLSMRAQVKAATIRGHAPRLISLSGKLFVARPDLRPLQGADVQALDSVSGWASVSGENGSFTIRDVAWYPGVRYKLLVAANDYQARQLRIEGPAAYPADGVADAGDLNFDDACTINVKDLPGRQSITHLKYDYKNAEYYRDLFHVLTKNCQSDRDRIDAINHYVAGKLVTAAAGLVEDRVHCDSESPRQVIESGTGFCGKLSLALATIAESADYRTRLIDMACGGDVPEAHAVAEVYYDDRWHLYDPTSGLSYRNGLDQVASYKELRLRPGLIAPADPPLHLPAIRSQDRDGLARFYRTGAVHYYYIDM